jgi:hypothetical protein
MLRTFDVRRKLKADGISKAGLLCVSDSLVVSIFNSAIPLEVSDKLYQVLRDTLLQDDNIKPATLTGIMKGTKRQLTDGEVEDHSDLMSRFKEALRKKGQKVNVGISTKGGSVDILTDTQLFEVMNRRKDRDFIENLGKLVIHKLSYPKMKFYVATSKPVSTEWRNILKKFAIGSVVILARGDLVFYEA